jgi:hypothetical protein
MPIHSMTDQEQQLRRAEWLRREAERMHDATNERAHRSSEGAVAMAQLALRTSVLINGGAAIAMLAFIGGLVGKEPTTIAKLKDVATSLVWFASGVACGTAGMAFSYFTNYCSGSLSNSMQRTWEHPYVVDDPTSKGWRRATNAFQAASVICGLAALVLFIIGMVDVRNAIVLLAQ